nr:peptidoglycan-binding domain-containing protein [Sphingobium yanoikuyae]
MDGRKGRFFVMALKGFQEARGLEQSGVLDAASRKALAGERAPTLIRMVLKAEALEASFTPDIPSRIVDQATLPFLGYRNLVEKLSERFHTSSDILIRLNPGLKAPEPGWNCCCPDSYHLIEPMSRACRQDGGMFWRISILARASRAQPKSSSVNRRACSESTTHRTG